MLGSAHAGRDRASPDLPSRVEEDLESILSYYAERNPMLPSRFRFRLKEQIDGILLFPESGAVLFTPYRRVLLKRFPYMAVYATAEDRIDVLALVSVRRDPKWIEPRLRPGPNRPPCHTWHIPPASFEGRVSLSRAAGS